MSSTCDLSNHLSRKSAASSLKIGGNQERTMKFDCVPSKYGMLFLCRDTAVGKPEPRGDIRRDGHNRKVSWIANKKE